MRGLFFTLFTLCVTISSSVFAFQGAEVGLFTPWKSVDQKMKQFFSSAAVTTQQNLGNFDVTFAPLTWHLSGVQANWRANYQSGPVNAEGYSLSAQNMSVSFAIAQMSVDQVVQEIVNGAVINVHVQASCGPITLSQPSAAMAGRLGFHLQGQSIATSIDQFDLQWVPGSWNVSQVVCTGPSGFDETLKQELVAQLQTAAAVKDVIQQALAQKIQNEVDQILEELIRPHTFAPAPLGLPLTLELKNFQSSTEGVLTIGIFSWSGNPNETDLRPLPANLNSYLQSDVPVIVSIPEEWSDLITAGIKVRPTQTTISLNSISAFQKILDCRLLQLFLWPDLWHYKKRSPFDLIIENPTNFNLAWESNGSAKFNTSADGWIQSVRKSNIWRYILLHGSLQGMVTPQIVHGNLNLTLNSQTKNGLKLSAKFSPEYIKAFSPNTTLSSGVVKDIQSFFSQGFRYQTALPEFDLGPFGKARLNGWQAKGGLILIPLELFNQ